jgi:hypothetical protein
MLALKTKKLAGSITYVVVIRIVAAVSPQFQIDSRQDGAPARHTGIPVLFFLFYLFIFSMKWFVLAVFKSIKGVSCAAD